VQSGQRQSVQREGAEGGLLDPCFLPGLWSQEVAKSFGNTVPIVMRGCQARSLQISHEYSERGYSFGTLG
jgi:hypothetical protein